MLGKGSESLGIRQLITFHSIIQACHVHFIHSRMIGGVLCETDGSIDSFLLEYCTDSQWSSFVDAGTCYQGVTGEGNGEVICCIYIVQQEKHE